MNLIGYHKLYNRPTLSHSEGKIKSYESCEDLRAWSHDSGQRDRCLRDWIRCDMPTCVLSVNTLVAFFKAMTSEKQIPSSCHPNCKSKIILDIINESCRAIRKCLKKDTQLMTLFSDEEFETSHWPCEQCLDALKSITLFWKIILQKVFAIKISKYVEESKHNLKNVPDVALTWGKEIIQQTVFIKHIMPKLNSKKLNESNKEVSKPLNTGKHEILGYGSANCDCTFDNVLSPCPSTPSLEQEQFTTPCNTSRMFASVMTETDNTWCEKNLVKIEQLKEKISLQLEEIRNLKSQNKWLKSELLKSIPKLNSSVYSGNEVCRSIAFDNLNRRSIPTAEKSPDLSDSELLITLKKFENESYKYVSLLKILHKTNYPNEEEIKISKINDSTEDPVEILSKVQATLGALVKKEIKLASKYKEKKRSDYKTNASDHVDYGSSNSEMSSDDVQFNDD